MNKIFLLTIDSLNFKNFNKKNFPELFKFKKNFLSFSNYYIHGGPTLQSFQSLFTMKTPLYDGGYNFGIKNKKTFLEKLKSRGFFTTSLQTCKTFSSFYGYPEKFDEYKLIANIYYEIFFFQKHFLAPLIHTFLKKRINEKQFIYETIKVLDNFFQSLNLSIHKKFYEDYPNHFSKKRKKRFEEIIKDYFFNKKKFIMQNFRNFRFLSFFLLPFGKTITKFIPSIVLFKIDNFLFQNYIFKNLYPLQDDVVNKILFIIKKKNIKSKKNLFFWSHFLDAHDAKAGDTNAYSDKKKLKYQSDKQRYYYALKTIDKSIANLIKKIECMDEYKNATFIISSDHGHGLNETKHATRNFNENFTHLPLTIYNKKINSKIIKTQYQNSNFFKILNQYLYKKKFINYKSYQYFENKGKGYTKFNKENIYLKIKNNNQSIQSQAYIKNNKICYTNNKFKKIFDTRKFIKYRKNIFEFLKRSQYSN